MHHSISTNNAYLLAHHGLTWVKNSNLNIILESRRFNSKSTTPTHNKRKFDTIDKKLYYYER